MASLWVDQCTVQHMRASGGLLVCHVHVPLFLLLSDEADVSMPWPCEALSHHLLSQHGQHHSTAVCQGCAASSVPSQLYMHITNVTHTHTTVYYK